MCSRASRILGLVTRAVGHVLSPVADVVLYTPLNRQEIENASVVWPPYWLGHIHQLHKAPALPCRVRFFDVLVDELLTAYSLQSSECRRSLAALAFLCRLLNGPNNCPWLLEGMRFRTPTSTRLKSPFELLHAGSNYFRHSPLTLLPFGNYLCSSVDCFADGLRAVLLWIPARHGVRRPSHHLKSSVYILIFMSC